MNHDIGAGKGTLSGYILGYSLSLAFTLDSYLIVTKHIYANGHAMAIVSGLAIIQLIVQLVFFLHLSRNSKARWNVIVLGFMLMVVFIVVFGSLWIMKHLNYNMTTPQQTQYLQNSDSL